MERMTYLHDGQWCIDGTAGKLISDVRGNFWGEAIDRLAAFEDKDVSLKELDEYNKFRNDVCFVMENADLGRLIDLVKADKAGRLLAPPCKVGDVIYRVDIDPLLNSKEITPYKIDNMVICENGEVLLKYDAYDGVICTLDSLVNGTPYLDYYLSFLSRKEAETALEGVGSRE